MELTEIWYTLQLEAQQVACHQVDTKPHTKVGKIIALIYTKRPECDGPKHGSLRTQGVSVPVHQQFEDGYEGNELIFIFVLVFFMKNNPLWTVISLSDYYSYHNGNAQISKA